MTGKNKNIKFSFEGFFVVNTYAKIVSDTFVRRLPLCQGGHRSGRENKSRRIGERENR